HSAANVGSTTSQKSTRERPDAERHGAAQRHRIETQGGRSFEREQNIRVSVRASGVAWPLPRKVFSGRERWGCNSKGVTTRPRGKKASACSWIGGGPEAYRKKRRASLSGSRRSPRAKPCAVGSITIPRSGLNSRRVTSASWPLTANP